MSSIGSNNLLEYLKEGLQGFLSLLELTGVGIQTSQEYHHTCSHNSHHFTQNPCPFPTPSRHPVLSIP